jgi:hypothetical protein
VSSGMPASMAACSIFRGPMCRLRSTNTVLMDCSMPVTRSTDEP